MRKFYLFFALLIGISSAAWADSFGPTEGAVYVIKVINNESGTNVDYYATYNDSATSGSNNVLTAARKNALTENSFFVIEAIGGNGATNGFTIRLKSDNTRYVYAINTNGGNTGNANVGTKVVSESEIPDDCKWQINVVSEGIYNIIPKSGSASWNVRGDANGYKAIGQWTSTDHQNCKWYIQTPTEMAAAAGEYDSNWSGKIGFPLEKAWPTWQITVTSAASTLETTFSAANVTAFKNALNAVPALKTPSAGLYKIKNVGTSLYLFQTDEGNPKNITLINDGGNNSKYYWKASFEGNNVTLTGSLGQAPSRGKGGTMYTNISSGVVMNTITMKGAPSASASYTEGAFLWPTVHTTRQEDYTVKGRGNAYDRDTNPYFLTTWDTSDGADQYKFVEVELADGEQIYTVNVDRSVYDCDANVTFNSNSYLGNKTVHDGGFFVLTSAPTAGQFSATAASASSLYVPQVAVSGNTIQVTYAADEEQANTVVAEATELVASSAANKVGYPNSTSAAYTELKDALNAYNADNTSADKRTTLFIKYENYKKSTTNIALPADGKAYTFKNVAYDSENRWYLKYVNETTDITLTPNAEEATTFVCRKVSEGQYAFVNNDGKYLAWKGAGSNEDQKGGNGNKGYVDALDKEESTDITVGDVTTSTPFSDWAELTVEKMIATGNVSGPQAALCGYMTIKGRRVKTTSANYFVIKADGAFDQATAPFFKTNNGTRFSSAFLIEEVPYANVVSLKDASSLESGKTIATFSAPFPTVVPENTTAYTVETTSGTNVTKVALQEAVTAGNAIPANQGVILIGTATGNVTMLPRTTEAITNIANNGLSNSAGAAVNVNDGNSYVLANKSQDWAFYKVSTAATTQLPMNKAYLRLTAAPETIRFDFGNATGIDNIDTDNKAESKIYDLSGRAVKTMSKGLYIVDGKKVIK